MVALGRHVGGAEKQAVRPAGAAQWRRRALLAGTALALAALAPGGPARAADGTWSPTPATNDYSVPTNWVGGVPPGINETAFFGASTKTSLTNVFGQVAGFTFNAGAPAYTFAANIFLIFNGAGLVQNGASVTFNVTAPINFNNASTAASATYNITGGSMSFNNTASAGNAIITNLTPAPGGLPSVVFFSSTSTAGNATITNQAGDTATQFGGSSTAGNATIVNFSNFAGAFGLPAGGLLFTNSSTAGNANITNHGTTIFSVGGRAGTATITNTTTGLITFTGSSSALNANITNAGTISFNQVSTAASAIITNAGTINFLGSSAASTAKAGSATITNNNGGTINFNNFSTALTANITNNNGGTIAFNSASSTAASAIIANDGILAFLSSSTAGSANITNTANGFLTFNNSSTAGTATIVSTGQVNFSTTDLASTATATFNSGGVLSGIGALGNTTFNAGATFIQIVGETFRFNGNLNLNAGSTLAISVTPTVAPLVTVTGTATLGGGVTVTPSQRLTAAVTYRFIDAAALSGTFSGITINAPVGFVSNPTFTYDLVAGDVFLNLGPGLLTPLLPAGVSQNVINVAAGIDAAILSGAPLSAAFANIFALTGANFTNALAQVSGQPVASFAQAGFQAMGSFLSLMLNPFSENRNGEFGPAPAYAPEQAAALPREVANAYAAAMPVKAPPPSAAQTWSIWAAAYGGTGTVKGDDVVGSAKTTSRVWGFATGLDKRVSAQTTVGFALAGGATSWSLADGLGGGNSDFFQAGLYGSHRWGAAYVSAALAYAWHQTNTSRTVMVGPETLIADFHANSFGARLEGGYRFAMQTIGWTPYAAVQAQSFRTPAYSERASSGPGVFALNFAAQSTSATRSELGIWFDKLIMMPNAALLTLRARAAWAHDFSNNRFITPTFQTLPGSTFTVNGAAPAKDGALLSAIAEYRANARWTVLAKFDGEFSRTTAIYAGTGTVKYAW